MIVLGRTLTKDGDSKFASFKYEDDDITISVRESERYDRGGKAHEWWVAFARVGECKVETCAPDAETVVAALEQEVVDFCRVTKKRKGR